MKAIVNGRVVLENATVTGQAVLFDEKIVGIVVTNGIYMEANLSAGSCIRFIECLLTEFGVEKDKFSFYVVAEEPSEIMEDEDE